MLPKMLQTEGRNPMNFTISRKKKKNAAAIAAATAVEGVCPTNVLSNYAIDEESKIIDQNSIFYGNEMEVDFQRTNPNYERILQEIIVPYSETDDDESKASHATANEQPYQMDEQPVSRVTRGILYDQSTQSKCLFILLGSSKWHNLKSNPKRAKCVTHFLFLKSKRPFVLRWFCACFYFSFICKGQNPLILLCIYRPFFVVVVVSVCVHGFLFRILQTSWPIIIIQVDIQQLLKLKEREKLYWKNNVVRFKSFMWIDCMLFTTKIINE